MFVINKTLYQFYFMTRVTFLRAVEEKMLFPVCNLVLIYNGGKKQYCLIEMYFLPIPGWFSVSD